MNDSSSMTTKQRFPTRKSPGASPVTKESTPEFFQQNGTAIVHGVVHASLFDLLKERKIKKVVILEGRPELEALRYSCPELLRREIQPMVITDNMAGFLFYKKWVKEIWIAYQTTEKNGCACSIGSLILAVLGKRHDVPLYAYPAEKKLKFIGQAKDLLSFNGKRTAPKNTKTYVPLIEWVPGKYITKIYE